MFDRFRSPAPCFTSVPPVRTPERRMLWFKPMLNVAVPPNAIALVIESDSVPDVAAFVVTVAPLRNERAGVVDWRSVVAADFFRVKFDVGLGRGVAAVLANRIESTITSPERSLVAVVLRLPLNTSENVSDVFSGVLQLAAVDQLLFKGLLPDQVVSVPADAVLAAAMQARVVARNLLFSLICMTFVVGPTESYMKHLVNKNFKFNTSWHLKITTCVF